MSMATRRKIRVSQAHAGCAKDVAEATRTLPVRVSCAKPRRQRAEARAVGPWERAHDNPSEGSCRKSGRLHRREYRRQDRDDGRCRRHTVCYLSNCEITLLEVNNHISFLQESSAKGILARVCCAPDRKIARWCRCIVEWQAELLIECCIRERNGCSRVRGRVRCDGENELWIQLQKLAVDG